MTATAALTTDLQRQVLALEDDLRARVAADAEREADWKREHRHAAEKDRTAASWVTWRDDRVTQAAVAWVLASVFIRFCEDNALVTPVWITGPEDRRQEALDAQLAFFRAHPEDTDREWLQAAIDHLAGLPATKALVDTHSALHLVSPSGDAVTRLLDFWRRRDEGGALIHDLADGSLSTRFLGDLYQDLSQHANAPSMASGSSIRPAAPAIFCSAPSIASSTAGTGTPPAWKPRPASSKRSTRSTASTSTPSPSPSPASASPSPRSRHRALPP